MSLDLDINKMGEGTMLMPSPKVKNPKYLSTFILHPAKVV